VKDPTLITYRATLDVPDHLCHVVAGWLRAWRRAHDARPWQRAATPWTQAVMLLRWARDDTRVHMIARDAGVSQATAYRYIHEAVDVVAAHGMGLEDVLDLLQAAGAPYVLVDGTLIESDRCRATDPETGYDLWYSGKHKKHGGNIQVLMDPSGYPMWTAPVCPGRTHDLAAAREHLLPALYPRAARTMPAITDKGYIGAGIGIHAPTRGKNLNPDARARNRIISDLRAPCERANAMLKSWKALQHITMCPQRIGQITAAILVLTHMKYPSPYAW
jgi:hypothetical protein